MAGALLYADSLAGHPAGHDPTYVAKIVRQLLSEWAIEYENISCSSKDATGEDPYNDWNMPLVSLADTCYNQAPNLTECGIAALANTENVISKLPNLVVTPDTVANCMGEVLFKTDKTDTSIARFRVRIVEEIKRNGKEVPVGKENDPELFCPRCQSVTTSRKMQVIENPPTTNYETYRR